MRNVPVPGKCRRVERITDNQGHKRLAQDERQQEELHSPQDTKERKEGIAVNVKGIPPLYGLFDMRRGLVQYQVATGNLPTDSGDDHTAHEPVPHNAVQKECQRSRKGSAKGDAVCHSGQQESESLKSAKGGIVASPMILGLLSVVCCLIDDVRTGSQQSLHLVQGGLNVHLTNVREASEVGSRAVGAGSPNGRSGAGVVVARRYGQATLARHGIRRSSHLVTSLCR